MQTNDIKVLLCWINKKAEDSLILCQGDLTVLNIDKMLEGSMKCCKTSSLRECTREI